jgi:hypothetical protein
MKKVIIILAVILTSGLTALSITKSNKKAVASTNTEKVSFANRSFNNSTDNLATAD